MRDVTGELVKIVEYIGDMACEAGSMAAGIREQIYSEEDNFAVHTAALDHLSERIMASGPDNPIHTAELLMIGHQWCADHIRRAIENPRGKVQS